MATRKRKPVQKVWTADQIEKVLVKLGLSNYAFDFDNKNGEFIIYTGLMMAGDLPGKLVEPE